MKKTLRLIFSAVLVLALVLSSFVFAHAVSVGTEAEFVSALSDGATEITITGDFNLTSKVTITESVKINGGDYTVTCTGQTSEYFVFAGAGTYEFNGGTFTTTGGDPIYANSAFTGTIKLTNGAKFVSDAPVNFGAGAQGTFILDGGILESSAVAIKNQAATSVQLLSGSLTTTGTTQAVQLTGGSNCTMTIGKPDGTGPVISNTSAATKPLIVVNATVDTTNHTIYGGTFTNNGSKYVLDSDVKFSMTISGGTFTNANASARTCYFKDGSTINITGGEFSTPKLCIFNLGNTADVNISGGTFTAGTVEGSEPAFNTADGGVATVTGGTFNFNPTEFVDTSKSTVTENAGVWTVVTADDGGSGGDNSDGQVDADGYVNVSTADAFKKAIADKAAKIKVIADFELSGGQLTIDFPVIINGNNKTITGAGFSFSGDNVIEIIDLNFVGSGTKTDIYKTSGDVKLTFSGGSVSGNGTGSGDEVLWVQSSTTSGAVITLTNGFSIDSTGGSNICVNISSGAAGKFIIDNADLISATRVVRCQAAVELKVLSGTLTSNGKLNALDLIGSSNSLTVGKPDGTGPVLSNLTDPDASALIVLNGSTGDNYIIYGGTFNAGATAELSQAISVKDGIELAILGGTYNFDPTEYLASNKYEVTEDNGSWTVTKVVIPVYVITFDAQEGTCDVATGNTNDDCKLETLPQAQKDGYSFDGWYDAQTGGNKITTETIFTESITVYARWIECDHAASTAQPTCKDSAVCSICGGTINATGAHTPVWKYDANQHWQECDNCGTVIGTKADHTGGTADCLNEKVCSEANCGQKYGEKDANKHASEKFEYTDNNDGATHTKKYACCKAVAAANEAHDYADTGCVCGAKKVYEFKTEEETEQVITVGEEATFTSVADFDKFVEVKVDGKTLVKDTDYTVVSGSTKVTLKADFVKTLAAGEHKLEIVSTNGAATTNFKVEAAPANDNNQGGTTTPDAGTTTPDAGTTTPDAGSNNVGTSDKTGDFTNIMIILALFVISGLGITTAVVYGKKRVR